MRLDACLFQGNDDLQTVTWFVIISPYILCLS